jgi:hypothetical protein
VTSPRKLAPDQRRAGGAGTHGGIGLVADARVQDPQALAEIDLYGELVIAASSADGPLTQEQIDDILGVRHTH